MDIVLRGLHVGSGELGLLCIILVLVEVAWGTSARGILRARIASLAGAILIFAHWLVSGIYYLTYYGAEVKPVIKAGSWPWAHAIIMESKEHVFLFLPFLAILIFFMVWKYGAGLREEREPRFYVLAVGGTAILVFVLMIAGGFLISAGYRIAVS